MSLSRRGLTTVVATFFGVGYFPIWPATLASFLGAVLAWFAYDNLLFWCVGLSLAGFWACIDARAALGADDPGPFVMDEVCGMALSVLWIPKTGVFFAAAFLLFRFFDAVKPWPISVIQNNKHSWSIMGDDLLAGVFTNLLLRVAAPLLASR